MDIHAEGRQARAAGSLLEPYSLEQQNCKFRAGGPLAQWVSTYYLRGSSPENQVGLASSAKGSVPSHSGIVSGRKKLEVT